MFWRDHSAQPLGSTDHHWETNHLGSSFTQYYSWTNNDSFYLAQANLLGREHHWQKFVCQHFLRRLGHGGDKYIWNQSSGYSDLIHQTWSCLCFFPPCIRSGRAKFLRRLNLNQTKSSSWNKIRAHNSTFSWEYHAVVVIRNCYLNGCGNCWNLVQFDNSSNDSLRCTVSDYMRSLVNLLKDIISSLK